MQKLRIYPLVAADLKEVCNFIADNNEAYAVKTISEIYKKFEIIQHFPEIGAKLSERVTLVQITDICPRAIMWSFIG